MNPTVNFKIGNEKLVRVLEGASTHLRGLLERQGRRDGRGGATDTGGASA